jgi:CRISPR-associated protein Csm1
MIILGDISGIQSFLFDVSESGGGQARRLRARSFLVQALTECAALRILNSMDWPLDSSHFLFSGAGKFILRGSGDPGFIRSLAEQLSSELLDETAGELRLALGIGIGGLDVEDYCQAQKELHLAKAAPWRPTAGWDPSRFVLPPLNTPCKLCRRAPGVESEKDPESGESREVCRQCSQNYQLGRILPHAGSLVLRRGGTGQFSWFGLSGELRCDDQIIQDDRTVAVVGFDGEHGPSAGCPPERFIARRLMTRVPTNAQGDPVWFTDLAKRSTGDQLLAVLKADVDSLGVHIEELLRGRAELTDFLQFADFLDAFFSDGLGREITPDSQWQAIYTVFAGGDDLVMIGPWDVMFSFAGQVRELFRRQFPKLTLSAGVSLFKPKRPVKAAIEDAERLLELAKAVPKDQCAAFGQVWNWSQHTAILDEAEKLANWVRRNQMQRGWLHTLLELAIARHGDKPNALATARLAYHVNRNYGKYSDVSAWADDLVRQFDDSSQPIVRFLPAIVRYALTATRTAGERE